LDTDLTRAYALVSGGFATRYNELATTLLVPAVKQGNLSSKATVPQAALLDAQPGQVRVLLYLSQDTSRPGQTQPRTVGAALRATMTKSGDGRWLISDLQPL